MMGMKRKFLLTIICALGIISIFNECRKIDTPGIPDPVSYPYDGVWSISFSYFLPDIGSCGSCNSSGSSTIAISNGSFTSSGEQTNLMQYCGTSTTTYSVSGSINSSGVFSGSVNGRTFAGQAASTITVTGTGSESLTITLTK
jgi:hypothetical protein